MLSTESKTMADKSDAEMLNNQNGKLCKQCSQISSKLAISQSSLCISRFKPFRARNFCRPTSRRCLLVWCTLLWSLTAICCQGETVSDLRPFPPPQNVAKGRPILTLPADSTCGVPARNAYCVSSVSSSSVEQCVQGFCEQACGLGSRTDLPNSDNLLIATSDGYSQCVEADTINVRPGSAMLDYATTITTSGAVCFLSSDLTPSAGANGSLTVTAWIWIGQDSPGTLLEKATASGSSILRVVVGPEGLNVSFASQTGQQTATLAHPIGQKNWTHLAVQMHRGSVSFFINGLGDEYTATSTVFTDDMIADAAGSFRLGQNADGSGQFLGKMQDVRYYSTTLSNREIQEVYSGVLPAVRIQNNCRCPPATPRIKPQDSRFCLSNGVPDNAGDATLRVSEFSHPVEYANDEDVNTVWISKFQDVVALDVDLGDQFEVFHIGLEFYSPLPQAIAIERLFAGSDSYQPWQYYAENCTSSFGLENNGELTAEDTVNCIQLGANGISTPYSKGSITFTVVASDRPGFTDYYSNPTMQQFVQASRVRVRFQGHFHVSNIRHEYFALYELRVSGRCGCNGHAESCSVDQLPYKCVCTEESHTQGDRCSECQPLYNNKPFRQANLREAFDCQYCECYNHSDSCVYNATLDPFPSSWTEGGGGVCINCRDNTEGQNCDTCVDGYFRPVGKSLSDADVCSLCLCNSSGTLSGQTVCDKVGGQCPCKANVTGRACDQCTEGSYNLQALDTDGCTPCECNRQGTVGGNQACDQVTGDCFCKDNVRGKQCNDCEYGFYNLNEDNPYGCAPCSCSPVGSLSLSCNPLTGQCQCKDNVQGHKCDECMDGFYNFSMGCLPCNCNVTGTEAGTTCDRDTGQCVCKSQTAGRQCNECRAGSSGFGNSPSSGCEKCICLEAGVAEGNMDCANGCTCKVNVEGYFCNMCKANFWNLTVDNVDGCQPCECDLTGVNSAVPCDPTSGQCVCLPNRIGRRCDDCQQGFFKSQSDTGGCLQCSCDPDGQLPGTTCNSQTGLCSCRVGEGVGGDRCDQCTEGFFNFKEGRCEPCNCLPAGSTGTNCSATGQCDCKDLVTNLQCDRCVPGASNLNALNPLGCSLKPSQQPAPVYRPLSPTSMDISWSPPDYPNGVIMLYRLFRNDTLVFEDNARHYVDTDLMPYTLYSYRVEAVNDAGSVFSPYIIFRTNPGTPSADMSLQVNEIQMASAFLSWTPPSIMNGPLLKYQLVSHSFENDSLKVVEWEGNQTQAVLTSLAPYQRYNLTVRACTIGGCADSEGVIFITKSAPPTSMPAPVITAISSTQLLVEWQPPLSPNGIISSYELWMRGLPGPDGQRNPVEQRIFYPSGQYDPLNPDQAIMAAPATSYNVTQLQPFTVYEFQVLAQNEVGRASSPWTAGRTQETLPAFMPAPTVVGISSTELNVTWSLPTASQARGNITVYRLYQNMARNLSADPFASPAYWQLIIETDGSEHSHVVTGLIPYAMYDFLVGACNSIGCVNSTASSGRTLPAAPEGMKKPLVDSYNSTVMEVKWQPPTSPNGPTPSYKVQKTNIALSYPASVVYGTRFPGGGYYAFPSDTVPQNVDFTGIRFSFRLQQQSGLLMFAASENQQEYIAVIFRAGRPRFMYDTRGGCAVEVEVNVTLPENVNLTSLDDRQVHTLQVVRRDGNNGSILVDGIYSASGQCRFAGISTFDDEGLTYDNNKWHTFKAQRFNGIYANVTVDNKWRGVKFPGVETYDDEGLRYDWPRGSWHTFQVIRRGCAATVIVDRKWTGNGKIPDRLCQNSSIIGPTGPLFVGGVPPDYPFRRSERQLEGVFRQSFQGCIHSVQVLKQVHPYEVWEELDWASAVSYELAFLNWQGCPINLAPGIHFMGKGYASIQNCEEEQCLIQGASETIHFQMRTALHTGMLFFVHGGTGIYIVAYMRNDSLVFEFKDGVTKIEVHYSDPSHTLCSGEWHDIMFTKTKQQGSISVDGGPSIMSGDPNLDMDVPVLSNILLGGIKPNSDAAKFLENNQISHPSEGFGGCIKNFMVNDEIVDMSTVRDLVNINLDGCPPFHLPKNTCQDSLITDIYTGPDNVAYDYGLLPYTDYIYRVVAQNSLGETSSPWGYGRTREGAPVGVGPPTEVRPYSGYVVEVRWVEPRSTSGLLTQTIILAYNMDKPQEPPITERVEDVNIEAINITQLTPNTNYRFKISACTHGGCTESVNGTDLLTPVEAPEEVATPRAVATATTLLVSWDPPAKPNGNITGYFLYQDLVEVYAGGQQQFLVTQLRVYTSYQFYVRACTVAGCSDGPSVTLSTAQMPPTQVKAPTLKVLGAKSIEVKWEEPEELNGVLERYLVYLSTVEGELGEVVHNTTIFFPSHIIDELQAGTTYYIAVGACTGGGCMVSNASVATTAESSPEGISAPVVTSPSSSQLLVTWTPPQFPNGVITSYSLYQNDVLVTQGLNLSHQLEGLQPYSLHVFRLQVCTSQGCGFSTEVEARTQEAPPEGTVVLTASVVDARTVSVYWTRPSQANGQLFFDVYFEGYFYADPDNWNYTVVIERRSLLRETTSLTAVEITSLVPLSDYNIQVNASNTKGFVLSNVVPLTMPSGSPDGVRPPMVESDTPQSLTVTWEPVGRVNALEEVAYLLQFRQQEGDVIVDEFGPTSTLSYRKTGLSPFTSYQFRLVVSNSHGSTPSLWVTNTTQQDKPSGVYPPLIAVVDSRNISLEWSAPANPNGIVTAYRLYRNTQLMEELPGNVSSHTLGGLTPYQQYSFQLEACTVAGCTRSDSSSSVYTLQAVPDGIAAPQLKVLTPSMIEIQWSDPAGPNGVISQFIIERKVADGTDVSVVQTFLPSETKSYIDDSTQLSPFTTYSYRVKVVNGAGTGVGPWANATTSSSRPAGVTPPVLTVLNSTSMEVTWSEPLQTNGIIEYYLLEWADARREIRNFTQLRVVLDNLVPYTEYSITLAACTSGGCTESTPAVATTLAAVPSGQSPPTATAISQSAVSVLWQPPAGPNGPNLRYELARRKIRQPLDSSVTAAGEYQSVYLGPQLFFEDRDLTMFTTYTYRVTVFNDIGQTTSEDSAEVTTFGGFPRRAPQVSATALSHLEIFVNWTMPDPVELQGDVQYLNLTAQSPEGSAVANPAVGTSNFTLSDLSPSTDYTVRLTITIFGGAAITSEPVTVATLDGAPEGIPAPVLSIVSTTALRVTWIVPERPNGDITSYNLIVNGETVPTGSTQPGSMILNELQPYTVYDVQVEACTVFRCARSDSTLGTTAEALPLGVASPVLTSLNATAIKIDWQVPSRPNGIVLRYDLWRKAMQSCSQVPSPEISPEDSKCTYLECSVLENFCGASCFTGAKVCCDGVLHDIQSGYDCCSSSYIPRPSPEAVCCAGKFYQPQPDFICCGTRYVQVLPGEVCCVSPVEDRVSVGQGDSCCAGVPYSSAGSQMCCGDLLVGDYRRQCCGGDVVTDTSVCCGNATLGQVYLQQHGYSCCGQVYSAADTSLCCHSDTGHTKVHYYESGLEKASANEVCCGLEKISAGLSCCNYVGYNPTTQICADRADHISGCGTGVVCPVIQSSSAQCNRCDFDSATTVCGSVAGYHVAPTTPAPGDGSICSSGEEKVYSGLDLSFTDGSLSAYSVYQYSVRVINSAGATSSPYVEAQTQEAAPSGVAPPNTRINPDQLYIIYLNWVLPQQPNGEIIRYILLRDGVELFRGLDTEFTDDRNVLPYRTYSYILSACTTAGCTNSPVVTVATAQGVPEEIPAPVVTVLSPTSLQVGIQAPGRPNGVVLQYTVLIWGRVETYTVKAPQDIRLEGLIPYTEYTAYVEVCTAVGCGNSPNVTVTTAEATPQGVDTPSVVVLTASSVDVYWKPPTVLNGQLQAYSLILQDIGSERLVYSGANLSTTVENLIPGRTYSFVLDVSTNGGSTRSQPYRIVMPTRTPLNVPPPETVNVLSATQMFVSWSAVVSAEGAIGQYRVLLNLGLDTEVVTGVGTALSVTLSGLKPYTVYEVRLQACLLGVPNGCGTSDPVVNRTYEAPPTGQAPPTLTPVASDAVRIEWEDPSDPNGVILFFRIFQRAGGATDSEILINQVAGDTFSFTHSGQDLQPYSLYQYGVMAVNSRGQTAVEYASVRTLQSPPAGLNPPSVNATSAYSIALEWRPPSQPNGVISLYKIYYRFGTEEASAETSLTVNGNVTDTMVSGLKPYSQYLVRLEAVNDAGSVSSTEVSVSTKQASPSGLQDFSVEKITTGNAVILRWDPPLTPNGVITTYRVYDMSDAENSIYRGVARVFEFRRLQPFTEYQVKLEACTAVGCTRGKEQAFTTAEIPPSAQPIPLMGAVTSDSVVLRWTAPLNANGKITSYEVYRRSTPLRRKRQTADTGPAGEVVYRTLDTDAETYEYADTGLEPYTRYGYKIRASNSRGFTDSPWQTVQTSQAAPEGVAPPAVSHVDGEVNSVNVSWSPPASPNGVLQSYRLRRNDSIPLSLPADGALFYVYDGLRAYTWYSFTLTVCSGGGCTVSDPAVVRTKEAAPLSVSPPTLFPVDSTSIKANWTTPQMSNGEINLYQLSVDGEVVYEGMDRQYTVTGLVPFQEYPFFLTACTRGGCTRSEVVTGRPDDSPPADLDPPFLRVVSSTAIEVSWTAPKSPNGVISSYDVRRDGNLIFTDSRALDGALVTAFTDYELQPGEEYTYTIIARNAKGSVESPPSQARTYSTSPTGLAAPALTPVSSTSIRATWVAPVSPNGQIVNYTLYRGNDLAYSGSADQLTYVVPGLSFFTQYTFRLQACTPRGCALSQPVTAQTMEAPPQQLGAPSLTALAGESGAHRAVLASWRPPVRPNGNVLYYQLQRRSVARSEAGESPGDVVLVHNGTGFEYTDADPNLLPYRPYQYMVIAINGAGKANSPWADITTKQAPPTSVDPPVIVSTTATTITVTLTAPQEPNGVIRLYSVLVDGTVQASGLTLTLTAGDAMPLDPFTTYSVSAQVCTGGGCTNSSGVSAKTAPARPAGLKPLTVGDGNSTAITLSWEFPSRPNGEILRFLVYQRLTCPPLEQPFPQTCSTGDVQQVFEGLETSTVAGGLAPYSAYQFLLQVENEIGQLDFPQWVRATTTSAAPVYANTPTLVKNGSLAVIDWTNSFVLNGRLREYILRADNILMTRGVKTAYGVQRTSKDGVINFEVEVVTDVGQAVSPIIIFDPNSVGNIGTIAPPATAAPEKDSKPWYEEVWFIIVIVILALLFLFVIFALCLRRTGPREPYIRERMPLPPEHQKVPRDLYIIDASDGSVIDATLSPSAMSGRSTLYQGPGLGVVNPAFDPTLPRLQTLSMDRGSKSSIKGVDDDDIDDIAWDKNFDSGLFDEDDDGDSLANPAYSYTKEQTVFTDTHL